MKVEFPSVYTPMTEPPELSETKTYETPSLELVFILPVVVLAISLSRIFRKKAIQERRRNENEKYNR